MLQGGRKGAQGACKRLDCSTNVVNRSDDLPETNQFDAEWVSGLLGIAPGEAEVAAAVARGTPIRFKLEGASDVTLNQAARTLAIDFVATTVGAGPLSICEHIPAGRG